MKTRFFRPRPLAAAVLAAYFSAPALAATFTVNDASDVADANPGDGVCASAGAVCTLRAAIGESNALAGADSIAFAIGGGAVTISPASPLPEITDSLIIDGYTQPGASANTLAVGNDAVVNIRLDGAAAGAGVYGLVFRGGSDNSVVRGLTITGFSESGILINGNGGPGINNITLTGNFIGTDAGGADLHNEGSGIYVYDYVSNCVIGGIGPADRNVISANWNSGILIVGVDALGHTVRNNYIGVTPAGTAELHNGSVGINIGLGSSTLVADNVIGGYSGIAVSGVSAYNVIVGNKIGVGADGVSDITTNAVNPGVAVYASAQGTPDHTKIGGTAAGEGNVIANWPAAGVLVTHYTGAGAYSTANSIRGNAIHDNGGLGIDLADLAAGIGVGSVNPNDAGDGDVGANGFQNFPVPTSATTDGFTTTVGLSLDGAPSSSFSVDVYASPACDASGNGEGKNWLGTAAVATDAAGVGVATLSGLPAATGFVTLTATDAGGNTSEFSTCLAIAGAAATPPVLGDIPDQVLTQGTYFSLDIAAYVTLTEGDAIAGVSYGGDGFPSGLGLTPDWRLAGTPTATGTWTATITVSDDDGASNADTVTFTVNAAPPAATPPVLADVPNQSGTVGTAYSLDLSAYVTATEGDAISAYVVTGTLPPGLTLNTATGLVSGTPTTAGAWTVDFTASDDDGASNADSVTFDVSAAPVSSGGTLQFAVATQTVAEAAGIVTVTVTRTGGGSGPVSVAYATSPGTATSPADFAAASGTLNWADGDTSPKTFTVAIVDDATVEGSEQFTVTLTDNAPTDTGSLGSPSVQTITIADDDTPPVADPVQPVPALGPLGLLLLSLSTGLAGLLGRRRRG